MEKAYLVTVYAHINSVPHGSTGKIMLQEHEELLARGAKSFAFWGRGRAPQNANEFRFATDAEVYLDVLRTRIDGRAGFHSKRATKRLLKKLDEINPDIVHLHNIHGYYVNIEMLFEWLVNHDCQVQWTLHDCWAFTGHCAYFTYVKCAQWRVHCAYNEPCCQLHTYPKTYSKHSCSRNFEDKQRIFTSIPASRMTLITPSHWLEDLVKESFLKNYPILVKHNTVDTTVFKPTPSDFREHYGIGGRFMILGVASPWTERKGLNDFVQLAKDLDFEKFAIVLVGFSKKQIKSLPKEIIGLTRTDSAQELAAIYTVADVFFNPTYEDNFPTVNLEAQSCGTRVITYDTGGCSETIVDRGSFTVKNYSEAVCALRKAANE